MNLLNLVILGFAVLFGLVFGSFLNVVIARLPHGQTLMGRSKCPHCRQSIAGYDLLPVLSFLLLRARCRHCGASISWRYPLIELAAGLLAAAVVAHFGYGVEAAISFVFGCALLVVTFIDYDHRIIPDVITLPGIVLGIVARGIWGHDWLGGVIGAAGGVIGLWLVAFLYRLLAGREGLGFGDVKLAGLLGAFLGGAGVFVTIFLASIIGSLLGVALIAVGRGSRTTALPFGSFMAPVGLVVLFYGPALLDWYLTQMRPGG